MANTPDIVDCTQACRVMFKRTEHLFFSGGVHFVDKVKRVTLQDANGNPLKPVKYRLRPTSGQNHGTRWMFLLPSASVTTDSVTVVGWDDGAAGARVPGATRDRRLPGPLIQTRSLTILYPTATGYTLTAADIPIFTPCGELTAPLDHVTLGGQGPVADPYDDGEFWYAEFSVPAGPWTETLSAQQQGDSPVNYTVSRSA